MRTEPIERGWANVPARDPDFAGREEQLAAVRAGLLAGGPVVLGQQYAELAIHLGHVTRDAPPEEMRRAAVSALRRHPSWLLVFDSVTDPATIGQWLPGEPGHVLITSYKDYWNGLATATTVPVGPLPRGSAGRAARSSGWRCGLTTCGGSMSPTPITTILRAGSGTCSPAARISSRPPTSSSTWAVTFRPGYGSGPCPASRTRVTTRHQPGFWTSCSGSATAVRRTRIRTCGRSRSHRRWTRGRLADLGLAPCYRTGSRSDVRAG
jgi:hypothetical protein